MIYLLESSNFERRIRSIIPRALPEIQAVYDAWDQDETGYDDQYGSGGICDDIADAICDVLGKNNIDCFTQYNEYEYHTAAYAYDFSNEEDERVLYRVDIPPYVYEEGAGYTWTKIPGVKFSIKDFVIQDYSDVIDEWFKWDSNYQEWVLVEY